MKKTILLLLISFPLFLVAQAPITFERFYDFGYTEEGYCVQQTADHCYIVCGRETHWIGDDRMLLMKTDSIGNVQWKKAWGNGNTGQEAYSVKQTNDSGYILSGYMTDINYNEFIALVKTDSNGDTLWTKKYTGLVIPGGVGYDVLQMPDSGYVVLAVGSDITDSISETLLIRTNPNGDTLWTKKYRCLYGCVGKCLEKTTDGGFMIGGYVAINNTTYTEAAYLIKTDLNGDTLWTKIIGSINTQAGLNVRQTSDGGYFIRGIVVYSNSTSDILIVKTNSFGDTLWTKRIGGTQNEGGIGGQPTIDGGYIISATTTSYGHGGSDVYLVKTNNAGIVQWTKTFGGLNNEQGDFVQQTTDRGFIISGITTSFGSGDVYLIKTDSVGYAPTGINEINAIENPVSVFPNPVSTSANILVKDDKNSNHIFLLYDFSGQEIKKDEFSGSTYVLSRDNLATGMFLCTIQNEDGTIIGKTKIIIQ